MYCISWTIITYRINYVIIGKITSQGNVKVSYCPPAHVVRQEKEASFFCSPSPVITPTPCTSGNINLFIRRTARMDLTGRQMLWENNKACKWAGKQKVFPATVTSSCILRPNTDYVLRWLWLAGSIYIWREMAGANFSPPVPVRRVLLVGTARILSTAVSSLILRELLRKYLPTSVVVSCTFKVSYMTRLN